MRPRATHAPHSAATATDERDITAVLVDWYDAISRHDLPAVAAALSPSFLIVEHDQIFDAAELIAVLTAGIGSGHQTAQLSDLDIVIAGDIAWSTHRNDEVWHPTTGDPTELEFLETVILRRHRPSWLIERYHATRLQPSPDEMPGAPGDHLAVD